MNGVEEEKQAPLFPPIGTLSSSMSMPVLNLHADGHGQSLAAAVAAAATGPSASSPQHHLTGSSATPLFELRTTVRPASSRLKGEPKLTQSKLREDDEQERQERKKMREEARKEKAKKYAEAAAARKAKQALRRKPGEHDTGDGSLVIQHSLHLPHASAPLSAAQAALASALGSRLSEANAVAHALADSQPPHLDLKRLERRRRAQAEEMLE